MTADEAAQWAEALSSLAAAALSFYMLWKMLPPDAQARARRWFADRERPWRRFYEDRRARAVLTFETFLAMEALDDYARGHDLQRVLEVTG